MEGLGRGDRVLTGHRIDHEERVVRLHRLTDLADLVHQRRVNREAAGGVDDQHVLAEPTGLLQPFSRNGDRVGLRRVDGHADLLAQHAQLLDRRRALEVGANEQHVAALRLEPAGQLAAVGGLAGSLEAGHQDDRGRLRVELDAQRLAAERRDQLGVHDLDDLLRRVEDLREIGPDARLADAVDEVAHDDEVHVGLEQRNSDLAQHLVDLGFAQPPAALEPGEDGVESIGEAVEHCREHYR